MFKLNKKAIITTMALACMSIANFAFASELIYKDDAGQLHYKPSAESRTIVKAEDLTELGYWIVPVEQAKAMNFTPRPVNEILQITEEEFMVYCQGEGGHMPNRHIKYDSVIVPVNEILDITEEEFMVYCEGEGGHMPNRFIKPGEMYNPATWGYTPKKFGSKL